MPCQCGTTATADTEAGLAQGACECATDTGASCECGGGVPTPSDHAPSLERLVMELDKRVRRLEATR